MELDPAVDAHISMPPALVEAVQEDPELLAKLTRGQLAVVQDRMVRNVLGNPDTTIGQLATVHKALSDNAQLKPAPGQGGAAAGTQLVINFIVGGKKEQLTIDNDTGQPDAAP